MLTADGTRRHGSRRWKVTDADKRSPVSRPEGSRQRVGLSGGGGESRQDQQSLESSCVIPGNVLTSSDLNHLYCTKLWKVCHMPLWETFGENQCKAAVSIPVPVGGREPLWGAEYGGEGGTVCLSSAPHLSSAPSTLTFLAVIHEHADLCDSTE